MLTRPIAFSTALLLGACATTDVSWVDPGVSQEPVAVTTLAAGIMDLAMSQGATPATAVHLIPLPEDHAADAITPALTATMARQHFAFPMTARHCATDHAAAFRCPSARFLWHIRWVLAVREQRRRPPGQKAPRSCEARHEDASWKVSSTHRDFEAPDHRHSWRLRCVRCLLPTDRAFDERRAQAVKESKISATASSVPTR